MGDPLTKVLLTMAQYYVSKKVDSLYPLQKKLTSVVGDDHISISPSKELLQSVLDNLRDIDFKISEVDTYISNKIMFYCEETCLVPQGVDDVPRLSLSRD